VVQRWGAVHGYLGVKKQSVQVSEIKTLNGFVAVVPPDVDVTAYTSVVIGCEAFSQFVSASKYRYTSIAPMFPRYETDATIL
jgi:hypothetical protein